MPKMSDVLGTNLAGIDEYVSHCETCRTPGCRRCGGPQAEAPPTLGSKVPPALRTLPAGRVGDSSMLAPWLRSRVGAAVLAEAEQHLGATRLVFTGPPMAGKTSLAIAMFKLALEREPWRLRAARFTTAHELARARSVNALGDEAPIIARALAAPLLVIDEVGGEDHHPRSAVSEVIFERHQNDRATWITTGVDAPAIGARYGGGIQRRIFEPPAVRLRLGGIP